MFVVLVRGWFDFKTYKRRVAMIGYISFQIGYKMNQQLLVIDLGLGFLGFGKHWSILFLGYK